MEELKSKLYTVSELNKFIKTIIEDNISDVYVTGETSNVKYHSSGHLYFSLKDENNSIIRCVMFKSYVDRCSFKIKDGDKINVKGIIDVYAVGGYYQIKVFDLENAGLGKLLLEFEKLKKKLEQEGLFDIKYKKNLPKFPKSIGIITSATGAAIQDIKRVISNRYPIVELILYPAAVQGETAKFEIINGLVYFNKTKNVDLIILGRGGGSLEDLWAFNEEIVARAIFKSEIPVISAVGHEIDFTISDFVADKRAATPSAAAEMAVPDMKEILSNLKSYKNRLVNNLNKLLEIKKRNLKILNSSRYFINPFRLIEEKIQSLDLQKEYLIKAILALLKEKRVKYNNLANAYVLKNINFQLDKYREKLKILLNSLNKNIFIILETKRDKQINLNNSLNHLSPLNILERGYSLVCHNDKIISASQELNKDDILDITFHKGEISAVVKMKKS